MPRRVKGGIIMKQAKDNATVAPATEAIKKKAHLPRNKKFFWMFFVIGTLLLLLGGALLPVWSNVDVPWKDFGTRLFSLIFFFVILIYIIGYLLRQIIRESKTAIKILTVFEAGFFFAVAIGSILQYFDSASIGGPGTIVGMAFWSRGFVYIVKAYLCKHEEGDKYPLWTLILSIGLVSLGSVMIANKLFSITHVVWVVSVTILLVGAFMILLGFISKPKVDKALLALKREQKKIRRQEKELAKAQKRAERLESKVEGESEKKADEVLSLEAPKEEADE